MEIPLLFLYYCNAEGAILTSLRDAFEAKSNRLFIPAPMSKEASDYGIYLYDLIN